MQITKTHKIVISIVSVLLLLGIYIAFDRKSKKEQIKEIDTNLSTTSTTTTNGTEIKATGTGGYKIESVPIEKSPGVPQPIPDLNRPIVSAGSISVSADAVVRATEKVLELQSRLKKNPADLAAWIDLGIYQKMGGDVEGVVISWTYATKLTPSNFVAFANLGDLYSHFLKDDAKAEAYYKQAISKAPTQAYLYTQLAEVYRYVFKDLTKAQAIVMQGLSKIPNDPNLLQLKTSLNQ